MVNFHIFTIFPESLESYFNSSILERAQNKKLIKIKIHDIRKFSKDKHRKVDDRPFGGGAGMVMKVDPIIRAIESKIKNKKSKILVILTSASGKSFNQKLARNFSQKYTDIAIICGRYEGVDERVSKILQTTRQRRGSPRAASYPPKARLAKGGKLQAISIGPYILTGGELPAMTIVDAVSRHIPGVLGKKESLEEEKGSYPVYTRPEVFTHKGKKYTVPKVLMSGDHKKINEWRRKNSKLEIRN